MVFLQRRSFVRGSKSEDQLAVALADSDNNNSDDSEDDKMFLKSSCHTLLDTDQRVKTQAAPHVSSESSSSRSLGSGTSGDGVKLPPRQASDETTSPDYDFSTSSLISCSEHYNGDSLVDHGQMSPQSPSSPDTPEWSLIANGDSFHKVNHCYCVVLLLL